MRKLTILSIGIAVLLLAACQHKNSNEQQAITLTPEMGKTYNAGQQVSVQLHYPADMKPDSIVY